MATTLYGNHREHDCPRCGYTVVLGEPNSVNGRTLADAVCPNCGQTRLNLTSARELPGDRLLVDKNVFNLRTPRRWEVAVFRCPVDDTKPYVKRIVGLPGESIQLRDGDVWANGELLRKTLPQCRECWTVVFDHRFAPPGGWGNRWLVEPLHESGVDPKPAGPEVLQNGSIVLSSGTGLTYRNWNLNAEREDPITDWLAYNGTGNERGRQLVHDFAAVFDLEVQSGAGSFACRLFDGLDSVFVEIPIETADTNGTRLGRDGDDPPLQTALRLELGRSYKIEFALIDRRASLAVNGSVLAPSLDLPADNVAARQGVSRPVQLGASGVNVLVSNFRLYRDVYYRGDAAKGTQQSLTLRSDEYFMLGDNSNSSSDSRDWAVPGVPEASLIGKPFLIHQPLKLGRVSVGGQERTYQAIDWSRLRWVR